MEGDDGDIGFEEQLEQEKQEKVQQQEKEAATRGLTYTDTDGTVMEWDPDKRAYFPKVRGRTSVCKMLYFSNPCFLWSKIRIF